METRNVFSMPRNNNHNCSGVSNVSCDLEGLNPMECCQGRAFSQKEYCMELENETSTADSNVGASEDITPAESVALIEANNGNSNLVILDVSTKKEYLNWHLEEAINLNFFSLKFRDKIDKLDRKKTYLVYCKMGGRSKLAQKMMKHIGFEKVYNIMGGRARWQAEELPFGSRAAGSQSWSFCPIFMGFALFRSIKKSLHRI